jgi:hypothetical protein
MTQAAARDRFLGGCAALAIVLTVAACTSPAPSRAIGSAASARAAAPGAISGSPPSPVTMAGAKHCPVTLPRRVGPSGPARQQFFGWGSSFGNGKLWVGGLWPQGVIAASGDFVDRRGRVGMKFGWWRKVPGRLHITGRIRRDRLSAKRRDLPDRGVLGSDRNGAPDLSPVRDFRDQKGQNERVELSVR